MLGQVFDVTKGSKHYGVDGGYNFFSGKDATKAFITGDFTEEGLIENIDDFEPKQCAELNTWIEFYHENYKYIGRLNGHFYDSEGNPTEALDRFHECTKEGNQEKEAEEADRAKFPPCNSRWSRTEGKKKVLLIWNVFLVVYLIAQVAGYLVLLEVVASNVNGVVCRGNIFTKR